jgi:dTDP-4-amino-4,6-dideoxygalactose transaminase
MQEILNFANPSANYMTHSQEIDSTISRILKSNRYILGDEVSSFEREFAEYIGRDYCIGLNSGTDALVFSLKALGIEQGDEVIVPSHTATPTVAAVVLAGGKPVFIDIDESSYNLNPEKILQCITDRTKAIVVVHLYGQASDMEPILKISTEYGLEIIEDCAQAHGALYNGKKVGTFGDISCFSFFPTKNLGGIGDGGAVVTNRWDLIEKIKAMREYGWNSERISNSVSGVSRLDEIQAGILRIKLKYLDASNAKRSKIALKYKSHLEDLPIRIPRVHSNRFHVFHLYVIEVENRNSVLTELQTLGINAGIHYKVPNHKHPAFQGYLRKNSNLEITERACNTILSLPMYPEISDQQIIRICKGLKEAIFKTK